MTKKLQIILFVLISFTLLPQLEINKIRIYEDNFFHVDDYTLDDGNVERIFAPNQLSEDIIYGSILLNNVDHIALSYIKLMLSALFFQEIHKPKRILVTGLGIGILPRALNYILGDTLHIDVVEIGRIIFACIKYI
jgi:hypothetical protein